jgi:TolB-like protein
MRRAQRILAPLLLLVTGSAAVGVPQERTVVAVLRFDNNTGDERYDHLGRAMSSMMISDLSVIDRIQLVERERIEELMAELDLQYSGRVDPESAQSLGMIVGAQYMVFGSFVTVDPEMRLDTRITRTETAEIVTTADVRGQGESLFDLQQQLADTLIAGLELVLTEEERARLRTQQEANRIDDVETAVAYSEALCLMDYGAYPEAFEAIQRVQSAAPGSQIVRATLNMLRDRAADDARNRITDGAVSRLGGVLGRNPPQPQPRPRPAQC